MKTATEKQAMYISKLSYNLYKLNGCTNFSTFIQYEDALRLSAEIADDLIKELKRIISEGEFDKYIRPYMLDSYKVKTIPFIRFNPKYEKMIRITPLDNRLLVILTEDNKTYKIDDRNLIIYNKDEINLTELYDNLIKCINFNTPIVIYTKRNTHYFFSHNNKNEEIINKFLPLVNQVLETMGNQLPTAFSGDMNAEISIEPILRFVEKKSSDTYNLLLELLNNNVMEANFFNIIKYAELNYFGLEFME